MSYYKTLNHIAELLSFTNDVHVLRENIIKNKYDWENIVKLSSKHLVLPTLFYRLKSMSLLDDIPEDLKIYLKDISTINKNRNKTLLKEIQNISNLFNDNNISHVFLKGSALIIGNYYEQIGERMIGDIDVLVDINQIEIANQLLINKNYIPAEQTFGSKYFEHKHLPRLRHKNKLAAVELHKTLLIKPFDDILNPSKVLINKRLINDIYIPSPLHLLYHNALNYQINDNAFQYLNFSFRSTYDGLIIFKTHPEINLNAIPINIEITQFFQIINLHFSDIPRVSEKQLLRTKIYMRKIQIKIFFKAWHYFVKYFLLMHLISHRLSMFLMNSNYRKDVLNDRVRILDQLKKNITY